jgi:hypothetical protein
MHQKERPNALNMPPFRRLRLHRHTAIAILAISLGYADEAFDPDGNLGPGQRREVLVDAREEKSDMGAYAGTPRCSALRAAVPWPPLTAFRFISAFRQNRERRCLQVRRECGGSCWRMGVVGLVMVVVMRSIEASCVCRFPTVYVSLLPVERHPPPLPSASSAKP